MKCKECTNYRDDWGECTLHEMSVDSDYNCSDFVNIDSDDEWEEPDLDEFEKGLEIGGIG